MAEHGISVIMAAYNAQSFLMETLTSINRAAAIAQVPCEVVLGIDGCHKSLQAARAMGGAKLYWSEKNVGPYVMFNSLVPLAQFDYLVFFGADDRMHLLGMLEIAMERHTCGILRLRHDTSLAYGAMGMWRTVWDVLGGYHPWRCQADTELIKRAMNMWLMVGATTRPVFTYVRHSGSLTRQGKTGSTSDLRNSYRDQMNAPDWPAARIEPVTTPLEPVQ